MMKIGYLGAGAWGFALASLLASKGHEVKSWTIFPELVEKLNKTKEHPALPGHRAKGALDFTLSLEETLEDVDLVVESVTSSGIRPVFEKVKEIGIPKCPIVLTSKGIESHSGLLLPDLLVSLLGENKKKDIGAISGPSYALEVIQKLPTAVVGTAFHLATRDFICQTFLTENFRVYPTDDIRGVSYGGALKNIIGIACGIAEGLKLGYSARASLMTRGLFEITKLALEGGAKRETLYGLSGMGDLCVTCSAFTSRNFRFGYLLTRGLTLEEAKKEINQAVEGIDTCIAARNLALKKGLSLPITETVYRILYEGLKPEEAVTALMQRAIKEENI